MDYFLIIEERGHGPHNHRDDNHNNNDYPDDSLRFFHKRVKI